MKGGGALSQRCSAPEGSEGGGLAYRAESVADIGSLM